MPEFLTNIDWSSPITIGVVVVVAIVVGVGGYYGWIQSQK